MGITVGCPPGITVGLSTGDHCGLVHQGSLWVGPPGITVGSSTRDHCGFVHRGSLGVCPTGGCMRFSDKLGLDEPGLT